MDFFDILLAKKLEDDRDPTIEGLSVTENGIYSEENKAYNPVIVEVPEPTLITKSITANGTYTASADNADGYSSVTVAVDGFKKKSIANTPTDIASFNDGTANPMPSLEISIEPQQDLHGYDYPWVGGAGKNKLNYDEWKGTNVNGGTAVYENNGATITATNNDAYTVYSGWGNAKKIFVSEGETVTLSWEESTNANGVMYIFPNGLTSGAVYKNNRDGKEISYTVASGVTYITFRFGVALSDTTIAYKNIMVRKSGNNTWQPYSNICPISGHTEADVTVTDDLTTPTETHTISIPFHDSSDPITVYGGTLNVTSGELRVTHANVDMGTLTWRRTTSYSNPIFFTTVTGKLMSNISMLCSAYKFSGNFRGAENFAQSAENGSIGNCYANEQIYVRDDSYTDADTFKTAVTGQTVFYELATPQTYQLTPTQVTTLLGQNNIFADCGQVLEGEYFVTL